MFKVLKLKYICIALFVIISSILVSAGLVSASHTVVPKTTYTIVIDAGHGGRDNGCSGINGTKESSINLSISKILKSYLETLGIRVVMTRNDSNGLYSANAINYKQSDMEKRLEIINQANPDMVISIHQNSFDDHSQCGAQTFYQQNDEKSHDFADSIQHQLLSQLDNARTESNHGDYYLLKESNVSAVIVECGYLTNPQEEIKLQTTDYQNKVAYAIMCGVVKYFELCGND